MAKVGRRGNSSLSEQGEGDRVDGERRREGTACSLRLIPPLTPAHPSPVLPGEALGGKVAQGGAEGWEKA